MQIHRMISSKRGFFELPGSVKSWLDTATNADRYVVMDDCEFAHELYGTNLLSNTPSNKLIILEPGRTYAISHYGDPMYFITSDINKYHIEHITALIVSITSKS